ncbi:Uma2 family endonuclease [Cyanothece sp. BG0011]|uniref:Uma2 family endonuclease n=1 Tax=Cyanothece sp. BG0011 TaxID=2082950 RepID=UPI000D1E6CBC|nr:Uma2 family endonuclease [Cyanothece sp. BG0011]
MTSIIYKWSIDEWHELVNSGILEGKPVELLEGDIIEMSPEGIEHSYTNQSVSDYLRDLLKGKAQIRESHPITLDNSEPEPDIAIVRLPETIYRHHHPYPQDIYWLIEVSNKTLKKDLEQKIITYARNKIPEYWVIDLKNKKLIVHTQPQNNNYSEITEYLSGKITSQAFPYIEINLGKLLLY